MKRNKSIFKLPSEYPQIERDLLVQYKNEKYDRMFIYNEEEWGWYVNPTNPLQSPVMRWCYLSDLDFVE
jgi:hypothetical protein